MAIDVNGVGYEVHVPVSALDRLGATGEPVTILTHLHIREQDHTLFGFLTEDERDLFRLLIQRVSGVGPKVAMAVLGGMSVDDFKDAVVREDVDAISRVKGIGKKTAERMVLELKDKVGVAAAWKVARGASQPSAEEGRKNDAVLALIALGYKQAEASRAVGAVAKERGDDVSVEDLIRQSLIRLQ